MFITSQYLTLSLLNFVSFFLQGFKARSKRNARRREVKFKTKVKQVCVGKEDA